MSDISQRMKQLRNQLGMKQHQFADELQVVSSNVSRYEAGTCIPSNSVLELICRKFNVSRRWLETGEGDMFQPLARQEAIQQLADKIFEAPSDTLSAFVSAVTQLTENDLKVLSAFAAALRND